MSPVADSHLTYIGSPQSMWNCTVFDVYPRGGGVQLGWVVRDHGSKVWRATSDDPRTGPFKVAKTRWQAATALWGLATAESQAESGA